MLVIPYNQLSHSIHMEILLKSRDMDPSLVIDLPEYGLIAFEQGEVVAAGFIRRIEGPYAMLDSYITNAKVLSEVRDLALDRITDKLIKWTASHQITKVISFTADKNTIVRAEKHGLIPMPNHLFQLKVLE